MAGNSEEILEQLKSTLIAAAQRAGMGRGLYGAEVGPLIRKLAPDYQQQFGVTSIRDFIQKFVPELRTIGASGSDVVYGLRDWPVLRPRVPDTARVPVQAGETWSVWVSPSSDWSIFISRDDLAVRTGPKGQRRENEVEIRPAVPEVHRRGAQAFLEEASEAIGDARARLQEIVGGTDPLWWQRWAQEVRRLSSELNRRWLEYRRNALERALGEELKRAGLKDDSIAQVLTLIRSDRELRYRQRSVRSPLVVPSPSRASVESPGLNVAPLVRELTSRMDENDLRKMSLLLGLIIDIVGDRAR